MDNQLKNFYAIQKNIAKNLEKKEQRKKEMKTISTTQSWINKRRKLVWQVQQSENDIIIYRHNKTKIISIDSLLKNYIKK